MSNKHNLVLYVDEELVEKTRNLGFNLSKTFENHLKHLLMQFSHANSPNNVQNTENLGDRWAGPDLNRRPSALSLRSSSLRSERPADVLTIIHQLAGAPLHSGIKTLHSILPCNSLPTEQCLPERVFWPNLNYT